ncbi:MAG: glycosyltransferase [Verrucomicrobiota bacterium]
MSSPSESLSPQVTIILPTYNSAPFLSRSISSVLDQTWKDFELIIIDNASTDGSDKILNAITDSRVRVLINETNQGYTKSLNRGLSLATGSYVARMDADDISHPTRLEKQHSFLENHPEIGILGTSYRIINQEGVVQGTRNMPETDIEIRWMSLLASPFCHPSIMIRRSVLLEHRLEFDISFEPAEDYDLWTKILDQSKGANLPEILFDYRMHGNNESTQRAEEQNRQVQSIAFHQIQKILPSFSSSPAMVGRLHSLVAYEPRASVISPSFPESTIHEFLDLLDHFFLHTSGASKTRTLRKNIFDLLLRLFRPSLLKMASMNMLFRIFRMFPFEFFQAAKRSIQNHLSINRTFPS